MSEGPEAPAHPPPSESKTPLEIFLAFSAITLMSFGGTGFFARRVLIEKRRWITHADYVAAHSVAQLLPGPNVFNLAVIIGHRFAGAAGSVAALSGLVIWPFLIMLGAGALYSRYGELAVVQRALNGVSAVAIGLAIANSIKLSTVLPKHWRPWLFLGLSFTAVGLLRLPLIAVIAVLGPLGMAIVWRDRK